MRSLIAQLAGLLLIATVTGLAVPGASAVQPPQTRSSKLKRLGYFLQSESREVRLQFAIIALDTMIAAYTAELEKLNTPGRHSLRQAHKRRRWATAVNQYLDYLYAFEEVIKQAPKVDIIADQPGPVQLLSGEFVLPISSPRIARPEQLENTIIESFCEDYPCDPLALEDPKEQPPAPVGRSGWSFRAGYGSTYQTVDGLNFMFSNVRNKARKEQISLRISEQLRQLGDTLRRARRRGRIIDWQFLHITSRANGDDQRLLLSAQSPALRLALPDLALAPGVLDIAKPWLKARLDHQYIEQFFPGADLLFAKLISARN